MLLVRVIGKFAVLQQEINLNLRYLLPSLYGLF